MAENLKDYKLVADYICNRALSSGTGISPLKLHKLLYYVQAWHLAFYDSPLINCKFQAWVHGPVCRPLYGRYAGGKSMYGSISQEELVYLKNGVLDENSSEHIDNVLETYMKFSDTQLEHLTHQEKPWIEARGDLQPYERCENEIDEDLMREFYKNRIEQ